MGVELRLGPRDVSALDQVCGSLSGKGLSGLLSAQRMKRMAWSPGWVCWKSCVALGCGDCPEFGLAADGKEAGFQAGKE